MKYIYHSGAANKAYKAKQNADLKLSRNPRAFDYFIISNFTWQQ